MVESIGVLDDCPIDLGGISEEDAKLIKHLTWLYGGYKMRKRSNNSVQNEGKHGKIDNASEAKPAATRDKKEQTTKKIRKPNNIKSSNTFTHTIKEVKTYGMDRQQISAKTIGSITDEMVEVTRKSKEKSGFNTPITNLSNSPSSSLVDNAQVSDGLGLFVVNRKLKRKFEDVSTDYRRPVWASKMTLRDKINSFISKNIANHTHFIDGKEPTTLSICNQYTLDNHESMVADSDRIHYYRTAIFWTGYKDNGIMTTNVIKDSSVVKGSFIPIPVTLSDPTSVSTSCFDSDTEDFCYTSENGNEGIKNTIYNEGEFNNISTVSKNSDTKFLYKGLYDYGPSLNESSHNINEDLKITNNDSGGISFINPDTLVDCIENFRDSEGIKSEKAIKNVNNNSDLHYLSLNTNLKYSTFSSIETTDTLRDSRVVVDISIPNPYCHGKTILEIGTGPLCVLAMNARNAGAKSIDALEVSTYSSRLASRLMAAYGTDDIIHVFNSHSKQFIFNQTKYFSDYKSGVMDIKLPDNPPYDMIISEILGDFASQEGVADVFLDLQRRILFENELFIKSVKSIPFGASTMFIPCLFPDHRNILNKASTDIGMTIISPSYKLLQSAGMKIDNLPLCNYWLPMEELKFEEWMEPQMCQHFENLFEIIQYGDFCGFLVGIDVEIRPGEHFGTRFGQCESWYTNLILLDREYRVYPGDLILVRSICNLTNYKYATCDYKKIQVSKPSYSIRCFILSNNYMNVYTNKRCNESSFNNTLSNTFYSSNHDDQQQSYTSNNKSLYNNSNHISSEDIPTTPPEVQSNSLRLADSSSNSLPVNGNATPGDRGEESETIYGSRGEINIEASTASGKDVLDVTSSGKPESDPRELEGQLNRKASTVSGKEGLVDLNSGGLPSGNTSEGTYDKISGILPITDPLEVGGELNKGLSTSSRCNNNDNNSIVLEKLNVNENNDIDLKIYTYPQKFKTNKLQCPDYVPSGNLRVKNSIPIEYLDLNIENKSFKCTIADDWLEEVDKVEIDNILYDIIARPPPVLLEYSEQTCALQYEPNQKKKLHTDPIKRHQKIKQK